MAFLGFNIEILRAVHQDATLCRNIGQAAGSTGSATRLGLKLPASSHGLGRANSALVLKLLRYLAISIVMCVVGEVHRFLEGLVDLESQQTLGLPLPIFDEPLQCGSFTLWVYFGLAIIHKTCLEAKKR